jgi:signal transduction histidine kinase
MPPAPTLPAHYRARARPAAWAAGAAGPAHAMPAAGAESTGFWFFACTALVLVAVLAFALGRARGAARRAPGPDPVPAAAAHDGTAGRGDGAAWQALQPFVPPRMHILRLDSAGRWCLEPTPGLAPNDTEALPAGWQDAAARLAPQTKAEFEGWTLQKVGAGATQRLLVWPCAETPAPAPAPSSASARATLADDASREAAAFSYTVSHDLRAPLRVVEGFARILKEDYGRQFDRIGNDHLDRVLAAAARMNMMIDAMLSMAHLSSQPLARQPVDLSQIAHFVVEELRRTSPQRAIEVTIEPGLRVVGDPRLLRQVLENLLSNAWKYTARCELARIGLGSRQQDGRQVFEVRDNGAGFDMRSADRLFGLFQRLHSQSEFPGTGVGLASVQRIVRRHGGDIWAESAPGQGASFSFTLGG